MSAKHAKHGGARPGAGRPKTNKVKIAMRLERRGTHPALKRLGRVWGCSPNQAAAQLVTRALNGEVIDLRETLAK